MRSLQKSTECATAESTSWPRLAGSVACALLLAGLPAFGLDPARKLTQFPLDRWQAEQGLPQSSVRGVAQTPDGYLWAATQKGLARFDGVSFTSFDKDNTPPIGSNLIHTLVAGPDGTLWFGMTGGGLGRMKQGTFTSFGVREGLPGPSVSALCVSPGGDLWVGTYGEGLARLRDGRIERVGASGGAPGSLILALCPGSGEDLWVATEGGTISLLHEGRFTSLPPLPGTPPQGVLALLQDRGGSLWIGSARSGIFRRTPAGVLEVPEWAKGLAQTGISSLLEDREGTLWLGTDTGEIHRVVGGRLESLGRGDGMPESPVRCLFEDPMGNLWAGTQTAGLLRLRNGRFTPFSTNEGLSSDYATGVLASRDGGLWVATRGGGLDYVDKGTVRVYGSAQGLGTRDLWSLLEARDGTLWVGTDEGGLFTMRDGRFTRFGAERGFHAGIVMALYQDRAGAIWAGTNGEGVFRITEGHLEHFGKAEGLASLAVHAILEDSEGTLWLGTEEGLGRLEDGRFKMLTTREGLSSDLVVSLYEDGDRDLWIGTAGGGLSVLRHGVFRTVGQAQGLFDNDAFAIVPDGQGNLWISCNRGIYRTSLNGLLAAAEGRQRSVACVAYGRADGMKSEECNGGMTPAGARLSDGTLCFPTIRGIVFIDPAQALAPMPPPKVLVESVTHDGVPLPRSEVVTLPQGVRHFEVHYTGLSSYSPERIRFRYRLESFDGEWIQAGTQRVAYYTNLRPGRYRFQVTAVESERVPSSLGDAIQIVIPPRFYETPFFFAAASLLLLLAVGVAYDRRVRNLRRRQRELETEVTRRTKELKEANDALGERSHLLEELNRELERISSEDSLTGLANRRHFDDRLDAEWRRADRNRAPLALISLDVDYFKEYNDAYGHPQGDACLQKLGECLRASFGRAADLPARLGGDEFCIILAETTVEEAEQQAEKIRATFEELAIPNRASSIAPVVTLSVGVTAGTPQSSLSADALLRAADRALYRAKELGKNRVCSVPLVETTPPS